MTDTNTSAESPLESRLRAAGAALPQPGVPDGAWQENQRRMLATSAMRRKPNLQLLLAAAVVVVLVIGAGAVLLGWGGGPNAGMPAQGGEDFWADSALLGPAVEVESPQLDGVQTSHEAVLSDTSGKGPRLCDRYRSSTGSAGGCTSRDPKADDPGVAFDWLTGTSGGGNIRGVLAGVDSRVAKVQIWMDNGDEVLANLKPGTWKGTKLFGLTVPADGPRPQRLVAFSHAKGTVFSDQRGTVLQSVDLTDRFGRGWLPSGGRSCAGTGTGQWPQPGLGGTSHLSVDLWSASASVIVRTANDASGSTCLALGPEILAGSLQVADHVVVVAGPGVVTVEMRTSSGATIAGSSRKVAPAVRSPFQVAALPKPPPGAYRLVALDATGQVVGQSDVTGASPSP